MNRLSKLMVGVMVAGSVVGSASALQIHSEDVTLPYTWSFVNNAGEVNLDGYVEGKSKVGDKFDSFCIENNEYFSGGSTYYVQTPLDMVADNGGVNTDAGYNLSVATAWLYSNFAKGQLSGYTYGSLASANALQNAIWMLEGEITVNAANQFYSLALTTLGATALNNATAGQYGVWALNLWTTRTANQNGGYTYSGYVQDQIWFDGGNRVPDGGMTVAMIGLALGGLAVIRRRM
jgi:hypothetical protein